MEEVKNEGLEVVTRNFKTREGYDVWDKLCSIPKYGFLISPSGGVAKVLGIGNWIDRDEAQSVVDVAQTELNEARAELAAPAAPAADAGMVLEQAMYTLISIGYHENSGLVHELRQALAAHRSTGVV